MSCLTEMMLLPMVSPNGDRVVDHRLLLGVASSSDRSWLHRVRGATWDDSHGIWFPFTHLYLCILF